MPSWQTSEGSCRRRSSRWQSCGRLQQKGHTLLMSMAWQQQRVAVRGRPNSRGMPAAVTAYTAQAAGWTGCSWGGPAAVQQGLPAAAAPLQQQQQQQRGRVTACFPATAVAEVGCRSSGPPAACRAVKQQRTALASSSSNSSSACWSGCKQRWQPRGPRRQRHRSSCMWHCGGQQMRRPRCSEQRHWSSS
jgi:hypothetical protein